LPKWIASTPPGENSNQDFSEPAGQRYSLGEIRSPPIETLILRRVAPTIDQTESAAAKFIGRPFRLVALEPDFSTTDGAAHCAEDPEHDTDHHKDSADGVKNGKACEVTNQEKDDAEHNHGQSDPVRRILELAYKE
jgi:hypothetical protein